ncbi:hypothetical protein ACRAWD_31120 [Caulobacter segnis]
MAAGDAEFIQEMVTGFLGALITGLLLMYVVLVLLFRSFAHPITIMVSPAPGHRRRLWPAGHRQVQLLDLDPDRDPDADGHRGPRIRSCWSSTRSWP